MFRGAIFLLLSLVLVAADERIVLGLNADFTKLPWMVQIQPIGGTTTAFCNGVAIHQRLILTTASCFTGATTFDVKYNCADVSAACTNVLAAQSTSLVTNFKWYNATDNDNLYDLALISLPNNLGVTAVAPIASAVPAVSSSAWVAGWGATNTFSPANPATNSLLQVAELTRVSTAVLCCGNGLGIGGEDVQIGIAADYIAPCFNDLGAPAFINDSNTYKVFAILSAANSCSNRFGVGAYNSLLHANVSAWIAAAIAAGSASSANDVLGTAPAKTNQCAALNFNTNTECRFAEFETIVGLDATKPGYGGSDECADAPFIASGTNFVNFTGRTASTAPVQVAIGQCLETVTGGVAISTNDVWFKIVPPVGSTHMIVDACSINTRVIYVDNNTPSTVEDTSVTVYSGAACASLNLLACSASSLFCGANNAGAIATFAVSPAAGATYWIRLGSNSSPLGSGNFSVYFTNVTTTFDSTIPCNPVCTNGLTCNQGTCVCGNTAGPCGAGLTCTAGQCVGTGTAGVFSSALSTLSCTPTSLAPGDSALCTVATRDGTNALLAIATGSVLAAVTGAAAGAITALQTGTDPVNQHYFLYTPTAAGAASIAATVNGSALGGSPFAITVVTPTGCNTVLPQGGVCTSGATAAAVGSNCVCSTQNPALTCPSNGGPCTQTVTDCNAAITNPAGTLNVNCPTNTIPALSPNSDLTLSQTGANALVITTLTIGANGAPGVDVFVPTGTQLGTVTQSSPGGSVVLCDGTITSFTQASSFGTIEKPDGCGTRRVKPLVVFNNIVVNAGNTLAIEGPIQVTTLANILAGANLNLITANDDTNLIDGSVTGPTGFFNVIGGKSTKFGDNANARTAKMTFSSNAGVAAGTNCVDLCGALGTFTMTNNFCWEVTRVCTNQPVTAGPSTMTGDIVLKVGALTATANKEIRVNGVLTGPTNLQVLMTATSNTVAVGQTYTLMSAVTWNNRPVLSFQKGTANFVGTVAFNAANNAIVLTITSVDAPGAPTPSVPGAVPPSVPVPPPSSAMSHGLSFLVLLCSLFFVFHLY